jgi:hypothetical protein
MLFVTGAVVAGCSSTPAQIPSVQPETTAAQGVREQRLLRSGERIDMPESDVSLVVPAAWEAKTMLIDQPPAGEVADEAPFGAARGVYAYPLDAKDPRFAKVYTGYQGTTWPPLKESGNVIYLAPDAYLKARGVNRIMFDEKSDGVRKLLLMVNRRPGGMLVDLALAPTEEGTTTAREIRDALQDCGLDFPAQ